MIPTSCSELEFAREVLVEDWLADAGPVRYLVHRGCVVALGHEDVTSRTEQLQPARGAGQSGTACPGW
jgi:hypothetical protein